jgi:hypothetical protein
MSASSLPQRIRQALVPTTGISRLRWHAYQVLGVGILSFLLLVIPLHGSDKSDLISASWHHALGVDHATFMWLLSYIVLSLGSMAIALLVPMQLRAWRYLRRVTACVGNIDQAAHQLPQRLLESARSYALYNGHPGAAKAVNAAFVGNHFAEAINTHQQAIHLSKNTKNLATPNAASRKRL